MPDKPFEPADDEAQNAALPNVDGFGEEHFGDAADLQAAEAHPAEDAPLLPDIERVDLSRVDADEAWALVADPIRLAEEMVGGVDAFGYSQLLGPVIEFVLHGECRDGLQVEDLVDLARTNRGHLDERFGADWQDFTELVVRGVSAQAGWKTLYEEFVSRPVRVGRRHNGLGVEKRGKGKKTLHMLIAAAGTAERHCPTYAAPLLVGTRDDPNCDYRDDERIEEWRDYWERKHLGIYPPVSFAEHFAHALARQRQVRALAHHAILKRGDVFGSELTPMRLRRAFSDLLLVGPLPYGPAAGQDAGESYRASSDIHLPGRDEALVEVVRRFRRRAVLYMGPPQGPDEVAAVVSDQFTPLNPLGRLPWTEELGIGRLAYVGYSWSAELGQLMRQLSSRDGGLSTKLWRLVGFGDRRPMDAVSIIERYEQSIFPKDCITRWEADCGPGLLKARAPLIRAGCTDLFNAANAAIVDAHRRRQRRDLGLR